MNAHETARAYVGTLGVTMTHHLVKDGGPDGASEWSVTFARNGQTLTTPFTMGSAFRIMPERDRTTCSPLPPANGAGALVDRFPGGREYRRGKRLPIKPFRGLSVDEAALRAQSVPEPPDAADVLYSLCADAESVRHGQTFEEWCADFGYDTDSRKAERFHNACRDAWSGLVRLGLDLDALSLAFQDY